MASNSKSSPWVWISLAVIVGLFAAFILFLDHKIVKQGRQNTPVPSTQEDNAQPIIDFYSILPDREIEIPDRPETEGSKDNFGNESHAKNTKYILQAGSFKKPEDAERRKAELAMLGLEAIIKRAEVEGVSYHRVELGPFIDDGDYSQIKNRLISSDIKYIAKTIR